MSIVFSFKLPAPLASNKKVSLSFEAVKPGINFSPAMRVLEGIFFQNKAALKICCLG